MLTNPTIIFAAIGCLFFGLKLIGTHMRMIVTRQVQKIVAKFSGNSWFLAIFGMITKAFVQESAIIVLTIAIFATSGVITLQQAMPMLIWSNIGGLLLVFLVTVPFDTPLYLFLLISGFAAFTIKNQFSFHLSSALFGLFLILFGTQLIQSFETLDKLPWLQPYLTAFHEWPFIGFLFVAAMTLISQSSTAVSLLVVTFTQSGLLSIQEGMLMVYGLMFGAAIRGWLVSFLFKQMLKRVMMIQVIFYFAIVALCLPLYYVEMATGIPLLNAAAMYLGKTPAKQIAYLFLLSILTACVVFTIFRSRIVCFSFKMWPVSFGEELSKPKYLTKGMVGNSSLMIDLCEKEVLELTKRVQVYFENFSRLLHFENPIIEPDSFHESFRVVSQEVLEVLFEVSEQPDSVNYSHSIQSLNEQLHVLRDIEEAAYQLSCLPSQGKVPEGSIPFLLNMIESIDALWLITIDAVSSNNPEDFDLVNSLTSDKGEIIKSIQRKYVDGMEGPDQQSIQLLLQASGYFERIVWLVGKYGEVSRDVKRFL